MPTFNGAYTVLKRVGHVAYQLSFPNRSKLHPIFHLSCLKKVIGTSYQTQNNILDLDEEGSIWLQPQEVLEQHEHHLHHCTIKEVFVKWNNTTSSNAT
jgi:hypothetical protein